MNFLRNYVLNNLALKFGSLVLALLLWSAIANEPQVEVAFQAPLELQNVPQNLELSSEAPALVQVRVRGPASAVRKLSPADLAVSLNLADFERPGERSYELAVSDVQIPSGVRVVQIIPKQVGLQFEARAEREIPVVPRITGAAAPGYRLTGYQVSPPIVHVVGPRSHVALLESATTDPVDVTGIIGRTRFWTNAFVPHPLVRIQGSHAVLVTVQLERRE